MYTIATIVFRIYSSSSDRTVRRLLAAIQLISVTDRHIFFWFFCFCFFCFVFFFVVQVLSAVETHLAVYDVVNGFVINFPVVYRTIHLITLSKFTTSMFVNRIVILCVPFFPCAMF